MSKSIFKRALFTIVLSSAALSFAAELTLYEDEDFRGQRLTLRGEAGDFRGSGFNDRASSMIIRSGDWQVCTDANFGGRCITLGPGSYRELRGALQDRISSVREVTAPANYYRPPATANAAPRIVLYARPDFRGPSVTIDSDVFNFESIGFNDRASSAVVTGGTWQLCNDEGFRGGCREFSPGRYATLGAESLSSARVVLHRDRGPGRDRAEIAPGRDRDRAEVAPPPPRGRGAIGMGGGRVTLYEGADFTGRSVTAEGDVFDFDRIDFNDRAQSARIEGGDWVFCSDGGFAGDCRAFGPGAYPQLPSGLAGRISSIRSVPRGGYVQR